MQVCEKTLEMIRRLSDAPGAPGFEDEVVRTAREYAAEIGRVEEDHIRNFYIHRKENKGNRPVIMLDAHSDETAFMIHSIHPNGTLRFVLLGGWSRNALSSAKVLVRNALGEYIPGIIAAKPIHFMTKAEERSAALEISDMVIDVGATSAEEAREVFHIRIGEPVIPATKFEYDAAHDLMFGKAFDCRIGCAVLIEALRRLQGKELACDVVGVLSTQEEIGDRGCRVAVNRVKPSIAVVLEGCPADDTFTPAYAIQTALKKGPMFRHMDISTICNPRYQRFTLDLAAKRGIPVQDSVREGGGNNGAVINTALDGAPAVVAGVPVRYIHSMNCMTSYADFEATVQITVALLEELNEEIIRSF